MRQCVLMSALLFALCGPSIDSATFNPGLSAQDLFPSVINVGVVNGKATSLPKPEYPEAARKAGISGAVGVNVVIDETGSVIFVEAFAPEQRMRKAEDGTTVMEPVPVDPLLRDAAETAARQAKFSPTILNGVAVKVKGKLVYNFVAESLEGKSLPRTISGGVLNGKAVSLPAPEYPAAAKAVRAQGAVSVQIMIDEEGSVISATAVSGHPLLRAAAEAAARLATFGPTQLSGQPVKVTGILTYNFVLPKPADQ